MVKCPDCNKEMMTAKTCDHPFIKINGKMWKRDTSYFDIGKKCHDCNIENKKGNIHHIGCDIERCPRCKGQLISCDCDKGAYFETSKTMNSHTHNKTVDFGGVF
jgi:hypothetical protein